MQAQASTMAGILLKIQSTLRFGQTPRHHTGKQVVDTSLEVHGTPVHMAAILSLGGSDGGVHILGWHISTVWETAGHVSGCAEGHMLPSDWQVQSSCY